MNHTFKSTLVPSCLFDEKDPGCFLLDFVDFPETAGVEFARIPQYDAVLVWAGEKTFSSDALNVLGNVSECAEYNKIAASFRNGVLILAVAQGGNLKFYNSFDCPDFTTSEFYIFSAVKSLQINPEVSTIVFCSPLAVEDEASLYRYFKSVEQL